VRGEGLLGFSGTEHGDKDLPPHRLEDGMVLVQSEQAVSPAFNTRPASVRYLANAVAGLRLSYRNAGERSSPLGAAVTNLPEVSKERQGRGDQIR